MVLALRRAERFAELWCAWRATGVRRVIRRGVGKTCRVSAIGNFIPPASEALALPLDELALRLLRWLDARSAERKPNRLDVGNSGFWQGYDSEGRDLEVLCAAQEAWSWLVTHGCLSSAPGQSSDGHGAFITRAGRRLLDEPDGLARLRAERRLDLDLHPRIAGRVRPQFLLGEFELAAFAAMREVEIRVRELSGASDSDIGMKLMTSAFRDGGPLADPDLDAGEREATMALFRGAIGVFKNPSSHRQVEFDDPTLAVEVVLFADLLLRMLDRRAGA